MIVDAHTHIIDVMRGRVGGGSVQASGQGKVRIGAGQVINAFPPIAGTISFPPETLLEYMDQLGVDRAVLLQGPFYGERNEYVQQAVRRWPQRLIGAAYLDLWSEHPREDFRRVVEELGFRVIKLELSEPTGLAGLHPDLRLDDPKLDWFWREVRRRNLTVTLDCGAVASRSYQTEAVGKLLQSLPGLRIVIAHLCQPPLRSTPDERLDQLWQNQVLLARHPTVWLDLASLPNYAVVAGEDYPYPSALRYLRRAVDLVGPGKLLWGSDVPGTLLNNTYPQLLTYLTRHCDFLKPADLAKILGENARQAYPFVPGNSNFP